MNLHCLLPQIKRVYAPPDPADGTRVLVDGLWPRGLSKERAQVDLWLRELAPSAALRRWFDHDPAKWEPFRQRYAAELDDRPAALRRLAALVRESPLTLLFAATDEQHNNAVALRAYLEQHWAMHHDTLHDA
jgi:uncharacterized protein YeaO (DUF488 family)